MKDDVKVFTFEGTATQISIAPDVMCPSCCQFLNEKGEGHQDWCDTLKPSTIDSFELEIKNHLLDDLPREVFVTINGVKYKVEGDFKIKWES